MAGTWYRTGTVAVENGSKTVNGVGTQFLSFVAEGFMFKAAGSIYEIDQVVSDSQLFLVENYEGPSASGVAYACAPTQAAIPPLTRRVTQLLGDVGSVKDAYNAGDLASTTDLDARAKKSDLAAEAALDAYAFTAAEAQSIFDNALPMSGYAALRAYSDRAKSVKITIAGINLIFDRSTTDSTSLDNGGSIIVDALSRRWIAQHGGVLYVEQFGASLLATAAENSAAISKAIAALQSGWSLRQKTVLLGVDTMAITKTVDQVSIKLNLRFDGTTQGVPVLYLTNFTRSVFDVSIDCNDKSSYGLRAQWCTGSVVPLTAVIKNIFATAALQAAAVFTRDSDDMQLYPTIQNIRGDGSKIVRGIMISDQTIPKNTSIVAPRINGVFAPAPSAAPFNVDDADGVYAEHSNAGHLGGLKFIGGDYRNCSKRNIKCTMANPTIANNTGDNSLATVMYSFVSVYDDDAGYVGENAFSCTGAGGVAYGLEYGAATSAKLTMRIGRNLLRSNVSATSSAGIRVIGKIVSGQIIPGEITGFKQLMQQSSATAESGQSLIVSGGRFDGLGAAANNCIGLQGGYARLVANGIQALDEVTGAFFIGNTQLAAGVAEISDVSHKYNFGMCQSRPLNGSDTYSKDGTFPRYELGRAIWNRDTPPFSAPGLIGDRVVRVTAAAGQPKAYTRVTNGVGNAIGTDWVSEGNL